MSKPIPYWLSSLVFLMIAWRFWHFGPVLDLPHDWRQADTAYYIWDFYQNGIDLLHPAVCWMGTSQTVILEFPLPEAIVAQAQIWLGESMILSRFLFLCFFLLCCYYFFRLTEFLFDRRQASWALIIYLSLPLAQYYSRAIHIDFFAQAFAYALFYYGLKGIRERSNKHLLLASGCTLIAFLVKIPYAFFLALPVLVYAYQQKAIKWLAWRSVFFLVPVTVFWMWQRHVYAFNSAAPNWDYILHYRKFDDNSHWYFGTLSQRLSMYPWKVISLRLLLEAGGVFLLLAMPLKWLSTWRAAKNRVLQAWFLGLAVYLLLFFNLNIFHNYYQIPFLGPIAILITLGLSEYAEKYGKWIGAIGLFLIVIGSTAYAEWKYYDVPEELDAIAAQIQAHTPADALPIIVYQDFDCRNPRLLYRAKRRGWSLQEQAATIKVVQRLHKEEGATHLIVVDKPELANGLSASFSEDKILELASIPTSGVRPEISIFQLQQQR